MFTLLVFCFYVSVILGVFVTLLMCLTVISDSFFANITELGIILTPKDSEKLKQRFDKFMRENQ